MRLLIATVVLIVCSQTNIVFAQSYDVVALGEYVMGDSDTKLEARRIALEQAKRSAVEQIGTYLESETIVVNSALTKDEIRTYTAAILKSTILSETLALLEDKSTVFRVKIKANVDAGVLDKRIGEIKADTQRKAQLALLQAENTKLLNELETLSSQLKAGNGEASKKRLREERESLFARLDKNENAIQFTFEKGTLLSLALKNEETLAQEKKDVDDFFQMIADNVKFKLGEPKIKLVDEKAELVVDVIYTIGNVPKIIEILDTKYGTSIGKDYSTLYTGLIPIVLRTVEYKGFGFSGINGDNILSYFIRKSIDLVLEVGGRKVTIPIANNESAAFGKNTNVYYIWVNNENPGLRFAKFFKISNIPKDELNSISSINAKVVISNRQ